MELEAKPSSINDSSDFEWFLRASIVSGPTAFALRAEKERRVFLRNPLKKADML